MVTRSCPIAATNVPHGGGHENCSVEVWDLPGVESLPTPVSVPYGPLPRARLASVPIRDRPCRSVSAAVDVKSLHLGWGADLLVSG